MEKHLDYHDGILEEMRLVNQSKDKTKGRTPKSWKSWVTVIQRIQDFEKRVPSSQSNDAARKNITMVHIGLLVHSRGDWVSKCIQSAKLINAPRNSTHAGLKEYLKKDDAGSILGIDKFLTKLEEVLGGK